MCSSALTGSRTLKLSSADRVYISQHIIQTLFLACRFCLLSRNGIFILVLFGRLVLASIQNLIKLGKLLGVRKRFLLVINILRDDTVGKDKIQLLLKLFGCDRQAKTPCGNPPDLHKRFLADAELLLNFL